MSGQDQNQTASQGQGTAGGATISNAESKAKLEDKIQNLADQASELLKNTHPLLNMYSVFQGGIIAAVSQLSSSSLSSSKCDQWVYYFTFSLLALLLYGVPLVIIAAKYVRVRVERDSYTLQLEKSRSEQNTGGDQKLEIDVFRRWIYRLVATVAFLLLLGFNWFVVYACHAMLCGSKHVSSTANCLQVCDKICNANN